MTDRSAFTISEFCARNKISRGYFYKLKRLGLGPAEMSPDGNLVRITLQSEAAWQQAGEARATATKPEANTAATAATVA